MCDEPEKVNSQLEVDPNGDEGWPVKVKHIYNPLVMYAFASAGSDRLSKIIFEGCFRYHKGRFQ